MSVKIKKEIQKIENDIIGYRRNFHQYPELSFKEFKTADTICNHLDKFGISYEKKSAKPELLLS